jgi:hypothetical protein
MNEILIGRHESARTGLAPVAPGSAVAGKW